MKNSKVKGLLGLLVLLFAVGLFGFFGYDTMDDIKLGLDLAGGVSITYQAVEENPSSEEMSDTIYKLQQRVQNYSTEAEVYQEGSNRINIDIPGVSDANAILEELGKPGSLIFVDESGNTRSGCQRKGCYPGEKWSEILCSKLDLYGGGSKNLRRCNCKEHRKENRHYL